MKDKKSILILYSKGLYDTNALELAEAIRSRSNDCYVIDVADEKYTNFGKAKLQMKSYKFSIRNARWAYSLYSKVTTKKKAPNKALKNIKADPTERTGVNKFIYDMTSRYYKVKNILRRYEPDIVLCFTKSVLKSAIKANEQLRMYTTKIYACLTDFGLDMRFYNRRAAGYIVQNEDIKRELVNLGIAENNVYVTSLIAREKREYARDEIKSEIGIRNDQPIVALIGGRYGASVLKSALSILVNYSDNFNIVVMSGGSKTIVNVAKQVAKDVTDKVYMIGKIDDIAKIYNVADVIVATPTSCVCAECLSYGKPLVLLKSSGNVEKNNAEYLIRHRFALDGTKKDKMMIAISNIILEGERAELQDYVEFGDINKVAEYVLDSAGSVFEEKKILLAEEKLKNADDDELIIEEVDTEEDNIEEVDADDDIEEIALEGNQNANNDTDTD